MITGTLGERLAIVRIADSATRGSDTGSSESSSISRSSRVSASRSSTRSYSRAASTLMSAAISSDGGEPRRATPGEEPAAGVDRGDRGAQLVRQDRQVGPAVGATAPASWSRRAGRGSGRGPGRRVRAAPTAARTSGSGVRIGRTSSVPSDRRAGWQRLEAGHQVAMVTHGAAREQCARRPGSRTARGPSGSKTRTASGTASSTDRSSASDPDAASAGEAAERGAMPPLLRGLAVGPAGCMSVGWSSSVVGRLQHRRTRLVARGEPARGGVSAAWQVTSRWRAAPARRL